MCPASVSPENGLANHDSLENLQNFSRSKYLDGWTKIQLEARRAPYGHSVANTLRVAFKEDDI